MLKEIEKQQIKKLCKTFSKEVLGKYYRFIIFEIVNDNWEGCSYFQFFSKTRTKIVLNLTNAKNLSHTGYPNDYYKTRSNKLKFVVGNEHFSILFILLHELRHAYQCFYNKKPHNELDADNYAIDRLKQKGILK